MIRSRARSSWACTGAGRKSVRCSCEPAQDPVRDPGDLLAAEDADDLVDLGELLEQHVLLPLGQAAGDDHAPDRPRRASGSSISSITPHDSCRAASMNPQVLTITRSACCPSGTSAKPSCASSPSIRSESTRFLEQPRLTKLMVAVFGWNAF